MVNWNFNYYYNSNYYYISFSKNTYEIKTFIRDSRLNQYISSYKLSGFRNSTVIAKGNDKFEQLDNDLKFEYMESVRKT